MVSIGHFHHWLIAATKHKETENRFYSALISYVDTVLSGSVNRGVAGITNKRKQIFGLVELSSRNIVGACLSSPLAYLEGLYLHEEYRGSGLGKEAMRVIMNWWKEKGYTELATDSELTNINAQNYFKAIGFQETYRVVEFCIKVK